MRHRCVGVAAIVGILAFVGTPATATAQRVGTGADTATAHVPPSVRTRPLLRISADGALSFSCGFKCAFGDVGSGRVRVEVPVAEHLAPWASWGRFWVLDVYCFDFSCDYGTGGEAMVGVTADLAGESSRAWAHPYLSAGVGRQRMERGETATTGDLGMGVLWHAGPYLAPRTELHWQHYPYAGEKMMVTVGLQLSMPRPRS